ncbi:metallophosphoesterase family protein [Acidicapsa acidisoli]|uniref:metallophosphoesterase family protein n=1 Tax=Acidicapsa acidisoli TaxID=1615681 RepID=UPI0021DFA367|nr:metallophosphoesterase [Acidicapsa acidisoli]
MASPEKKSKHHPTPKPGDGGSTDPVSPPSSTGGSGGGTTPPASGQPVFGQPTPSPDPTTFKDPVTDSSEPDVAGVQPVPQPATTDAEPILTLAQVYGSQGATITQTIQAAGQIVFHSVGDTGSVKGPGTQSLVADKMVSDFTEANAADVPSFYYHLGDVVYYFGEAAYYYDQFFEPYRNYPVPILGIAGNHDGIVYPGDPAPTLAAYLANFCAATPGPSPNAGDLDRTTMIQPGVYYTFDAPFVRILGLYSNVLEDPGVISDQNGTYPTLDQCQITFLTTALNRVKSENYTGALIIATHHPAFTGGSEHGGSPLMLQDIDKACTAAGVWPHAVLSGHSHNYQRYTRTVNGYQIPYIVAGCGGHSPLSKMRATIRTPFQIDSTLTLESYDDTDYGYLRIVVNAQTMTIEFHPESDGGTTKTPDDDVTINLAARTIS